MLILLKKFLQKYSALELANNTKFYLLLKNVKHERSAIVQSQTSIFS